MAEEPPKKKKEKRKKTPAGEDHWRIRRRVFTITILFAAILIGYVVFRWDDTRLAETIVLGAFGLWGAVVGAYAGFATWEDIRRPDRNDFDEGEYL